MDIMSCEPGRQVLFVAPTPEVEVSDANALVMEKKGHSSTGSAGEGGLEVHYDTATQSPPEGNRDNYDASGWAMVVTEPGILASITLQQRSSGTIKSPFPVWLKIWLSEGGRWRLLGTSCDGIEQKVNAFSTWTFSGIELEAGMKLHIDAHRSAENENLDAFLSTRAVVNTLADTGMIDGEGTVNTRGWVPDYALVVKRPAGLSARGLHLATRADLEEHAGDAECHLTADEREAWNRKADASALGTKVNSATFSAHAGNAVLHVTSAERERWNAVISSCATSLVDVAGNAVFAGGGDAGDEGMSLTLSGTANFSPTIQLKSLVYGDAELGVDHLALQRQTGRLNLWMEGNASAGVVCNFQWECNGEVTRCDLKELLQVPSYFAEAGEKAPLKGRINVSSDGACLSGGGCRVEVKGGTVRLCVDGASAELGEEQIRRLAALLAG